MSPRPGVASWLLLLCLATGAFALGPGAEDAERIRECRRCGMDRKAYGYSRALVVFEDGGEVGTCSLHCAVAEQEASPGRAVKALLVADRNTHALLEAASAQWVMGGRKRPVMAARAKWAFATREAAEAFVREHGGELVPWEVVLAAAREDVARDPAHGSHAARAPRGCMGPG